MNCIIYIINPNISKMPKNTVKARKKVTFKNTIHVKWFSKKSIVKINTLSIKIPKSILKSKS